MNEKGMPLLQMTPVADSGRDPRTVLKVEVAPPLKCAVAVVLDLSDSCATMQVEIARLPRLFEALPRSWPVWIYRLSEIQPLHSSATVAHVCDRSVDLMQWAGDRRTVERAQGTGSYLRPPLEAIIARAEQAGISRVKVLILTDGELLDSASLAVPQGIEVVGLTARQDGNSQACWHRVRPDSRLCLLSDSTLDECFRQADCTFYGSCQIALDDLQAFKPILHRNSQSGTISTIDQPSVSWNFVDGPLLLQISAAPNALANSELVVKSLRTNTSTHLKLEGVSPIAISPQELAAFAKMPARELRSEFEASADDKNFPVIWSAFCEAAKIAIDRASWVDEAGHLRVFTDAIFRGRLWNGERISVSDSWLCLCNTEPGPQPSPGARLVILALSRSLRPAVQWDRGEELPFGSLDQPIRIEFDVMEGRWMVRYGTDEPRELNPLGSQELPIRIGDPTKSAIWKAYFSGSLR